MTVVTAEVDGARPSLVLRWWRGPLGRRFLWEASLVAGLLLAYKLVRFFAKDQGDAAVANARRVIEWEKSVGLWTEAQLQETVLRFDGAIDVLNRYYVATHFAVTALVLFWIFLRHPAVYGRIRNVLVVLTLSALFLHVLFPLAPPRMLTNHGFVDTLAEFGPAIYGSPDDGLANQFAAMPSLHFGYAALAAWAVLAAYRSRWRWLALAHPLVMLVSIVATANHYWADALIALAILVASALVFERRVRRARRRQPDEALDGVHDGDTDHGVGAELGLDPATASATMTTASASAGDEALDGAHDRDRCGSRSLATAD